MVVIIAIICLIIIIIMQYSEISNLIVCLLETMEEDAEKVRGQF